MTGTAAPSAAKRKWYGLALRHLRMAARLLRLGFADGAAFHAYHAYECVLSAFIAAHDFAVPPEGWTRLLSPSGRLVGAYPSPSGGITDRSAHVARIVFFDELADRTKPYYATHVRLSNFLGVDARNAALYYDANRDLLPHQQYSAMLVAGLLPVVRQFAREAWREIRR
jgi:hypothetical protein